MKTHIERVYHAQIHFKPDDSVGAVFGWITEIFCKLETSADKYFTVIVGQHKGDLLSDSVFSMISYSKELLEESIEEAEQLIENNNGIVKGWGI